MAKLICVDGTVTEIPHPVTMAEAHALLYTDMAEVVYVNKRVTMLVDEDARYKVGCRENELATALYCSLTGMERPAIRPLLGNVIVLETRKQWKGWRL